MKTPSAQRLTETTRSMQHSFIRQILKVTKGVPGVISFAGGLPSSDSFPREQLATLFAEVVQSEGEDVLQYGASDGDLVFKKVLREYESIPWVANEEMIITLGSTNGIYYYTRCLTDPGDVIICEAPSFPGSLTAMEACGAQLVGVEMDEWGIDPQQLRETLRKLREKNRPVKFIYLIPEFQNPTGKTMSLERRRAVIELALEFDLPILEDIPYRELRYSGERLTSMWELAHTEYQEPDLVTSAKSLSKILGPGLRLGATIGPADLIGRMVMWAQKCTVSPEGAAQRVAARFIERGWMKGHIERIIGLYRPRLQTMLAALQAEMPAGVTWTHPEGGMFIWLMFPETIDTEELFHRAIAEKVAFIPGSKFYPTGVVRKNEIRLNFSYPSGAEIATGIHRLGRLLQQG